VTTVAPQPGPAPAPQYTTDQLTLMYRQLREKKDELDKAHKAKLKPFNEAMEQIEGILATKMRTDGLQNLKTENGTAFFSTRTDIKVQDASAFREWAQQTGRYDMFQSRVSKEAVEEFVKSGNPLPPGLAYDAVTTVIVRK